MECYFGIGRFRPLASLLTASLVILVFFRVPGSRWRGRRRQAGPGLRKSSDHSFRWWVRPNFIGAADICDSIPRCTAKVGLGRITAQSRSR